MKVWCNCVAQFFRYIFKKMLDIRKML